MLWVCRTGAPCKPARSLSLLPNLPKTAFGSGGVRDRNCAPAIFDVGAALVGLAIKGLLLQKAVPNQHEERFPVIEPFTERVLAALASTKHIPREQISLESSLPDLGFDSLDKVTLLFELEKQFQLSIPDEEVRSIHSVRDIVEAISRLVASASSDFAAPEGKP